MERHPAFRHLCKVSKIYRFRVAMSDFGGHSEKPSWLYSNCPWIAGLQNYACPLQQRSARTLAIQYVDASGNTRVKGGPDLKQSQAYPAGFGRALVQLFFDRSDDLHELAKAASATSAPQSFKELWQTGPGQKCWKQAHLGPVIKHLLRSK